MATRTITSSNDEGTFKHTPLSPGRNIRLLWLEPSRIFDSEIRCSLHESSLEDAKSGYEALSYVWGTTVRKHKVVCNGQPLYVTNNCLLALKYLRKKKERRVMWIDAICIDQTSDHERGHQVELMGDIYQLSRSVIIWLGEEASGPRKALRHAKYLRLLMQVPSIKKVLKGLSNLTSILLELNNHEWFRRIWTVQEFIMSPQYTFQWGSLPISDSTFEQTLNSVKSNHPLKNCVSIYYARVFWTSMKFSNIGTYTPASPIHTHNRIHDCGSLVRLVNSILMSCRRRSCSEPLDRIYGAYGLYRSTGFNLPTPNYGNTMQEAVQELTFGFIKGARSLWPLHAFIHLGCYPGGSSWAINWTQTQVDIDLATSSWGIDEESYNTFRQGFEAQFEGSEGGWLFLKGILHSDLKSFGKAVPDFGIVGNLAAEEIPWDDTFSYRKFNVPLYYLRWLQEALDCTKTFGNCPDGSLAWEALHTAYFKGYYNTPDIKNVLQRMMVNVLSSGMAASSLPRHVHILETAPRQELLARLDLSEDTETSDGVFDNTLVLEFVRDIIMPAKNCPGGTLFRTPDGWVGVSMKPIEPSDVLALLHGAAVPAILRPAGKYYKLVCFASVQGMPADVWPIQGDEIGVQEIVLI